MEIGGASVSTSIRRRWIARRLAIAVVLTAVAYGQTYAATLADSVAGSRTPVLAALPFLVVLIAAGHRTPPRGVGDTESNWIIAVMVAAPALAGFELLRHRLPSLSALWHLPDFGAIVWFAALLTVLFGVRHVVRMWPLWIFAVGFASPLPSLLMTAVLGGSDIAAAAPAVAAGAVAVFLACPAVALLRRLVAASTCFLVATTVVLTAGPHLPLTVTALVVGAALPVATTVLSRRRAASSGVPTWSPPHHNSARSLAALAVIATALAVLNPATVRPAPLPTAAPGWIEAAGLTASSSYAFITRYAGPAATFVRYRPTTRPGSPALAVDVITTPHRAALTAIGDPSWYPASLPVDFRPAPPASGLPAGARIAHTNADAARDGDSQDWVAIAWDWQTGEVVQRVTVVADQSLTDAGRPPEPSPVRLLDVSLRPALWIARQQPHATGDVDDLVLRQVVGLAVRLSAAGTAHPADGPAADA
ncbi:hypothetical protein AU195_08880 [Mycobacterium sp. IS-1496]|uniref:hypothetical protein n=1 Tax=Mycobacterium sp. IS-1496 TaxID=1772284 RepID=UPI0007415314|nr:hypothetical protein [Mycobacterium sp. IS-1496]KUI32356.1 hypothetical protein AU195_08880 [Mycobacterium sp. IS-1496]